MSDLPYWPEPVVFIQQQQRCSRLAYRAASSPARPACFMGQIARLNPDSHPVDDTCVSRLHNNVM